MKWHSPSLAWLGDGARETHFEIGAMDAPSGVLEQLRQAREAAMLGSYESSLVFYAGALAQLDR